MTPSPKSSITRRTFAGATVAGALAARHRRAFAQASPEASPAASPVGAEITPPEMASQPQGQFPLTEEKKELTVLVANNAWVGSFEDNDFTRWYEEKTNVHINWTVLPSDDASSALNVRLASGDLPDILLSTGPSTSVLQLHGAAGTFIPLNDLIDQHGVYTKWVFEQYPVARDNVTATDGNIYSLPTINDCYHCQMSQKMWLWQPWFDQLGKQVPTTTDEFADYLRAIKNDDPNGNGQGDEIPITSSPGQWSGEYADFLMNAFVFSPTTRRFVQDGKVVASYTQDGWREGVKWLAGLYAEGLIDPESFTQDYDALVRTATADPHILGGFGGGWIGNVASDWNIGANYHTIPPIAGPDGLRVAPRDTTGAAGAGVFIITNKCADPELAFRWADGLYEYEATTRSNMGIKDEDWRWAREGELGIDGQQGIWMKLQDLPSTQQHCWSQTGNGYRSSAWRLGEVMRGDVQRDRNTETILYDQTSQNYEPYAQPEGQIVPVLYFTEEQATTIAESETSILPYVEQTFAQAVIGQLDIEASWQEYLTTLDNMGFQAYMAAYQEAYDAKMNAG